MFANNMDASKFESEFKRDIKRSFRRLSKKHHPDHGGDSKKFMMINDAYNNALDLKLRVQRLPKGSVGINISARGAKVFKGGSRWYWI